MGIPLNNSAYIKLIDGDIEWLKKATEPSLEQVHIIKIL